MVIFAHYNILIGLNYALIILLSSLREVQMMVTEFEVDYIFDVYPSGNLFALYVNKVRKAREQNVIQFTLS